MEGEEDRGHGTPQMARIVERNIQALLQQRVEEEERLSTQHKIAQKITDFTGSLLFVYIHAALFGAWIVLNLPSFPAIVPKFDPSYVKLAMFASVEAIFLSTFILITQNRMMKLADRRADLNLQISLLSEHEVTRLIKMTAAICERLGIEQAKGPDLHELAQDIKPEKVLQTIRKHEKKMENTP
jgi:uncharacterized membrane protein